MVHLALHHYGTIDYRFPHVLLNGRGLSHVLRSARRALPTPPRATSARPGRGRRAARRRPSRRGAKIVPKSVLLKRYSIKKCFIDNI